MRTAGYVLIVLLFCVVFLGDTAYARWDPKPFKLSGSLFTVDPKRDRDNDYLDDVRERELAEAFKPTLIFDTAENARRPNEPVTLFQVRPEGCLGGGCPRPDCTSSIIGAGWQDAGCVPWYLNRVWIKYGLLFARDGGYGGSIDHPKRCPGDDHNGDNENFKVMLMSIDGITWKLVHAYGAYREGEGKSWRQVFGWPEWADGTDSRHMNVYMSAGKHHMFGSTEYDHEDSPYSDYGCNDDVNGRGDRVTPELYGNVGEPGRDQAFLVDDHENHDPAFFVNDLSSVYPGENAWSIKKFSGGLELDYDGMSSLKSMWLGHAFHPGPQLTKMKTPTPSLDDFDPGLADQDQKPLARFWNKRIKDTAAVTTSQQKKEIKKREYMHVGDHGLIFATKALVEDWSKRAPDCTPEGLKPSLARMRKSTTIRKEIPSQRSESKSQGARQVETGGALRAKRPELRREKPEVVPIGAKRYPWKPEALTLKLYYSSQFKDYVSTTSSTYAAKLSKGSGRYRLVRTQGFLPNAAMVEAASKKDEAEPLFLYYKNSTKDHRLAAGMQAAAQAKNEGYQLIALQGHILRLNADALCKDDSDCGAGMECQKISGAKCGKCRVPPPR